MTVLVLAAHPDDEVLGCGGTIARLSDEGAEVVIAILGEGATSRSAQRADTAADDVAGLEASSRAAAALLGAREVRHLGLPDNRFDSVDLVDVVKLVEGLVGEIRPDTVFTQHGGDLNVDHRTVYGAALTATRPLPGTGPSQVLSFEVASSTEWAFDSYAPAFRPSVFVDISTTLDRKLAAMEAYPQELRPFPHPRSLEGLRAQAVRRGTTVGVAAAEAFELVWARR